MKKSICSFIFLVFLLSNVFSIGAKVTNVNLIQEYDPLNLRYHVIDVYADGSHKLRGYKDTLTNIPLSSNIKFDQEYTHPLSEDKIALVGGDEVVIGFWSQIDYANFPGDLSLTIADYENAPNDNFSLALTGYGNNIEGQDENADTGNVAIGDVDGNLRSDVIVAYTNYAPASGELGIQIRILEQWSRGGTAELVNNRNHPFVGDQELVNERLQSPQVITANLDDDPMSEFIVFGVEAGVVTAWVFDDIMNSVNTGQIKFGDQIAIKTKSTHKRYIESVSSNLQTGEIQGASLAPASFSFTIVNPNDTDSTELVNYGDFISLMDNSGKYWSVNTISGDLSLVSASVINDTEIFTLEGSKAEYEISGGIYTNSFATIKSTTGVYASGTFGEIGTAVFTGTPEIYKITNATAIPNNLDATMSFLFKIQDPDLVKAMSTSNEFDYQYFGIKNLVAGNIDNDPQDEFVIVGLDGSNNPRAWVFDDRLAGFAEMHEFSWPDTNSAPLVDIGDVDSDGRGEFIFSITDSTDGSIYVYDDAIATFSPLSTLIDHDTNYKSKIPRVYGHDIDGDGEDEILFLDDDVTVHLFQGSSGSYSHVIDFPLNYESIEYTPWWGELAFGDVDHDAEQEIVVSYSASNQGFGIAVYDWDGSTFVRIANNLELNDDRKVLHITVGDFNGDQFTLEFTNNIGEFQTAGELEVIGAAPPNQLGISQNYAATGTTFGKSVSNSQTSGNEVSSGYGYYLEAQIKPSFFDIVEIGVAASESISHEFSETNTIVKTIAITDEFTGGNLDDFAVYTTTIYDYYVYKILDSVDPRFVGQNLTINVPREPSILLQTKEYYNSHNNDADYDIGTDVFVHTPGHVPSYPTREDVRQYSTSYLETTERTVGQGGGNQAVQIDLSQENTQSFVSTTTSEESLSGGVTIFGIGGGGGGTWTSSDSSIHEVSLGENTAFRGEVGSINDHKEYEDFQYSFGMAIYLKSVQHLGRTIEFFVMNYWVTLPPNWGGDSVTPAEEARDAASNVNNLADDIPGMTIQFATITLAFGALFRYYYRRRN